MTPGTDMTAEAVTQVRPYFLFRSLMAAPTSVSGTSGADGFFFLWGGAVN